MLKLSHTYLATYELMTCKNTEKHCASVSSYRVLLEADEEDDDTAANGGRDDADAAALDAAVGETRWGG